MNCHYCKEKRYSWSCCICHKDACRDCHEKYNWYVLCDKFDYCETCKKTLK